MRDLALLPAHALLLALSRKEVGSEELLERFLERIARLDGPLGAVVALDEARAREEARRCDEERARGTLRGPLHGLPVTVKDAFETAGLRTACGFPPLAAHVPERDAAAVARLKAAGAIVFGKTNTPALANDIQTANTLFGTTSNPWDLSRTSGGSSGGSAVAMAMGFSGLELGSDLGGSVRIPAAFCGVFGHRPSRGLVPTRGHVPGLPGTLAEPDFQTAGPLARSAEDLDLALSVLAGPSEEGSVAWRLELPPPRRTSLEGYRIAAWLDDPAAPVDGPLRARLEEAVGALRAAGARVDAAARPGFTLAENARLFRQLLYGVMAIWLPDRQFEKLAERARGLAEGDDSLRALFTRATVQTKRDWDAAHERRERHRVLWAAFFRDHDALLAPAFQTAAFPHETGPDFLARTLPVNGERRPYFESLLGWSGLSGLCHLPSTVVPVGRTGDGLPAAVQVIGPFLEDRTAIDVARRFGEVAGGFVPPPGA